MDRQFFFPYVDMSTPKGPIKSDRMHSKWQKSKIRLEGHKEQILRKLGFSDLTKSELEILTDMLTNVNRVIAKIGEYLDEFEMSKKPPGKLDFSPPKADESFKEIPDALPSIESLGVNR